MPGSMLHRGYAALLFAASFVCYQLLKIRRRVPLAWRRSATPLSVFDKRGKSPNGINKAAATSCQDGKMGGPR